MANLLVKDGNGDQVYIAKSGTGTDADPFLDGNVLAFQRTALLANGATYTSGFLTLGKWQQVQTNVLSNKNGTITITFSSDDAGADVLRTLTIPYIGGSGFKMFSAPAFTPFVQYEFTCDETGQTDFYFDTKFLSTALSGQVLGMDDFISPSMVGNLGRNVIVGQTDNGGFKNVPVTAEGHLEVAIHDPLLPFGSLHTESLEPIFQVDAVYGINPAEVNEETGINVAGTTSATNTGTGNLLTCSTGTTAYSYATMQSHDRLRYRAGQGIIVRYSAIFSTPQASSIVVAGCGSGESGFYFGYNGTSFGILHSTDGVREIQTLTISTASTTAENITITLNGTAFAVPVTNSGSTAKTAYEIASFAGYVGFSAEQRGSTVVFLAGAVGNKAGAFTLSGATTAVGTFAETLTGVSSTDTWIPQTSWNGDVFDGTGASGVTLDPSKGNVYQIGIQYLGFGAITFKIETSVDGNNPIFVTAHTINVPNTRTTTTVSQPSFPFTMSAYSAGSTTNVSVSVGSFAGFIEGKKKLTGPRLTFNRETNGFVGSTASTYYPLLTVRNDYVHGHSITERANQSIVNLISMSCAHDDATPVAFYLIKNATLLGTPNFTKFSTSSCTYWDVSSTTCTVTNNEQLIASLQTGQASGDTIIFSEDIELQPGETITLAGRAVTATASFVNVSLNTREDQ